MDKKLTFIEEAKIKKELTELEKKAVETPFGQSNPIRANLMKFVNFKGKKLNIKDLF